MVQSIQLKSSEKIKHFATLGSTNATAKAFLTNDKPNASSNGNARGLPGQENAEPLAPPFWIIADEQTEGRGRQGRNWVSISGNLFTSTVQRINAEGPRLSSISLVTGLAVCDAIVQLSNNKPDLTLKWPNDILFHNAKLGGILIEGQPAPDPAPSQGATDLIIGIGINISSCPVIEGRDTTCLKEIGLNVTRDQLFNKLVGSFHEWLARWDNGNNINLIKSEWLKKASPIGSELNVKCGPKHLKGTFIGLDELGGLKLKLSDNTITTITAGELL